MPGDGGGEAPSVIMLHRQFRFFSVVASVNHALTCVVVAFASSLLEKKLAGIVCGLTFILSFVGAVSVATFAVKRYGFKNSMIVSIAGHSFRIICLYYAIVIPSYAYPISIGGTVIAGMTSAIWWTAQGTCFEITCEKMAQAAQKAASGKGSENFSLDQRMKEIRADLSAEWTVAYQISHIAVFLTLSLIPLYDPAYSVVTVISWLCLLGVGTVACSFMFDDLGHQARILTNEEITEVLLSAPNQFRNDARNLLLMPFVFGFGVTTAMFAYYINGDIINNAEHLGDNYIGLLEAFSYLVPAISAYPYAYFSNNVKDGQHWVLQFGSLTFLLSGLLVLVLPSEQLMLWQSVLLTRGLFGLGRGVFEGQSRGVYAEMFSGDDLATAFSIQTMLVGLSGGICFFAYTMVSESTMSAIVVINGVVALASYALLLSFKSISEPVTWPQLGEHVVGMINLGSSKSDYQDISKLAE
jgi:hypothetical protein